MKSAAAVYIRISSAKQDHASQVPDIARYVAANGLEATTYRDTASGKTMSRPGFEKLMEAVRAGRISTVIVWRLDRLGRTASGLTSLFDELRERKVNLVSIKDGLDLATPAGRLMSNVLASVAQFETEIRAERVLAGLAVAKANGVRLGRPAGVRTRISITTEQVATMRTMKAEGLGVSHIARATGVSRQSVYDALREAA